MFVERMCKVLGLCLAAVLLAGMAWAPARPAGPNTYTVGAAGCDFTTIQAALDDDRVIAGDVIQVTDAVHTEAGIAVGKDVTIQGQGADQTIVQAHATLEEAPDRVFRIMEGAAVAIKDMTIRHGNPHLDEDWRGGGGISNRGTLTLENCIVIDNTGNDGGAIWNYKGAVTAIDCTFSHNVADRIAPSGYECGSGGAIKLEGDGSTLDLTNCTISDNEAKGKGGGIFVACYTTATLTNSTISGNQAANWGGGLYTKNVLHLTQCTVVNNRSGYEAGGGVYVRATLHITNTIIANNGKGLDCVIGGPGGYQGKGQIGANSNNLIGDGSYQAAYSGDPMLGELADHGGSSPTHTLLPGSPAIDAVPASDCSLSTDQRGLPRPVACISSDTPGDLGAFEVQADEYIAPKSVSEATPGATSVPPMSTVAPAARATPTPEAPASPAASGDLLLPGLGLLGLLLLGLIGLVVVWRWRRGP